MCIILEFILNNFFSIITAIVAIIAIFQTGKQIKISNKQHLFDRRLKNYSIISGLISLYEENESLLKEKSSDDEVIDVELLFYGLVNNSFLENQHNVIEHPLEQPYQNDFFIKLEELKAVANEVNFIYKNKKDVVAFVLNYKEVLYSIYKYKNLQNRMLKQSIKSVKEYKQVQKNFREPQYRKKLFESYNNLINSYEKIKKNNSIKKIEKEIKL